MRLSWFALGACAGLAACAPAGYYDPGYSAPGYAYAAPGYGYAAPYGYATGPVIVGGWEGGRRWDGDRYERERRDRERAFRGGNPNAPRVWAGGGRVQQPMERRAPPVAREVPRASNAPRVWP